MRKLASVQVVAAVADIPGADKIEKISVMGWSCVAKKDEFKVGDKCVYFEIDAKLPEEEWCGFMKKSKFRVRTIRLRGQISQGLALPLSILPEGKYEEGDDVTELLGVVKYEPPVTGYKAGDAKGPFPIFLKKTDEMRVQSYMGVLNELEGKPYIITQKVDGTSATYFYHEWAFGVCSRNLEIMKSDTSIYWQMSEKYNIEQLLRKISLTTGVSLAIQGEIVGPGIQKNRLNLKEKDLYLFNIYNIAHRVYLPHHLLSSLCNQFKIPKVPVVEEGDCFAHNLETLIEMADANGEGIVVRPQTEIYSPILNGRLSFKVISPNYLLKTKS